MLTGVSCVFSMGFLISLVYSRILGNYRNYKTHDRSYKRGQVSLIIFESSSTDFCEEIVKIQGDELRQMGMFKRQTRQDRNSGLSTLDSEVIERVTSDFRTFSHQPGRKYNTYLTRNTVSLN